MLYDVPNKKLKLIMISYKCTMFTGNKLCGILQALKNFVLIWYIRLSNKIKAKQDEANVYHDCFILRILLKGQFFFDNEYFARFFLLINSMFQNFIFLLWNFSLIICLAGSYSSAIESFFLWQVVNTFRSFLMTIVSCDVLDEFWNKSCFLTGHLSSDWLINFDFKIDIYIALKNEENFCIS